ncbi:MAG: CHAT domain-containing protein [Nitrospirota bacterium]
MKSESDTLHISVLHGDLNHTSHPILLSHYEGDTIAGAERIVDKFVGNGLSQRYHLGRYPGKPGTVAVVLSPPNEIQESLGVRHGAIVIGLGKWGELTPSALTQAVHQGITEYCLHINQCGSSSELSKEPVELTINSLLIGSNTSANIAVEDSVNAIVRGAVLANRALANRVLKKQGVALPRVTHIEFIELYLDVAVDAAKSAHRVAKRIEREFQAHITVEPHLKKGKGGQTRLVPTSSRGYWRRWTVSAIQDAPPPASLSLPPVLKDRLRTMLQEDKSNDPQVWSALLDLAFRDRGSAFRPPHKLRFLALSDRARAEVTVQESQPELIAQLIQRSIEDRAFRQDTAKTLFELLIPLDLKDSLLSQDNVVLILDDVTAHYPWELMIDTDEPLCVRMGMIRQLETADYDVRVRDSTSNNVYVVGDPLTPSNYRELLGAKMEAEIVASLLTPHYTVTHSRQRLGAVDVLNQLVAQPYRIVHIAGHGYYNEGHIETAGAKAGVVLDDGLFLTAAEIAMLDPIPELVFLNCCYLGQIGGVPYNKVAASISRELIRKGVRAVVAAGWPVQDDAALSFAEVFYKELLAGQSFGRALKEARKKTWEEFPDSNTWGAYQAYGDPDFCLNQQGSKSHLNSEDVTVAAEEVLIKLDKLSSLAHAADPAASQQTLVNIEKDCPPDWLKQGAFQERLGQAYGEHGLFKEAIEHYQRAVESEDTSSSATLRVIEQWINLAVRLGEKDSNKAMIEEAIGKGGHLLSIAETAERLNLIGSAHKKLAQLETDAEKVNEHLMQSAAHYRKAANRQQHEEMADPYPIINMLVIEALLGKKDSGSESSLSTCESLAKERFQQKPSAWDAVTIADVALIRAFLRRSLPQEQDNLVRTYRSALTESSATPREQDSALAQMKFARNILGKLSYPDRAIVASAMESLDYIQQRLQPRAQTTEPPAIKTKQKARLPLSPKASAKQPARKSPVREKGTRRLTHRGKGVA